MTIVQGTCAFPRQRQIVTLKYRIMVHVPLF